MNNGISLSCKSFSVTLPMMIFSNALLLCDPITMMPAPCSCATLRIDAANSPSTASVSMAGSFKCSFEAFKNAKAAFYNSSAGNADNISTGGMPEKPITGEYSNGM